MRIEDLLKSISRKYLHFNRVDSYKDFPGADRHDGEQLPIDQNGNKNSKFIKSPTFSAFDSYNKSRARTYACCFSTEDTNYIWSEYGNGGEKGKACLVFEFGKLRLRLNETLQPGNSALEYNGKRCRQIFSVNYGCVEYVGRKTFQANTDKLPNPIKYTYFKDKEYEKDKELRISLSTIAIGKFVLNEGSEMEFPPHLQVAFDFKAAIEDGTSPQLLVSKDCDLDFLHFELKRLGVDPDVWTGC
ncbi:MAG: hypothetical protein ACNS63_05580 [Candidatus Nitrospinota bacterium M3_3B_026]